MKYYLVLEVEASKFADTDEDFLKEVYDLAAPCYVTDLEDMILADIGRGNVSRVGVMTSPPCDLYEVSE